jgi:folate-binding protein YgfZ
MESGYQEARRSAAFDAREERGRVCLDGADVAGFLHAQLTNDIAGLAPGSGCYAALLTPQGRMISDMEVLRSAAPDGTARVVLAVPAPLAGGLATRFDGAIFTEDVRVTDVSASTAQFGVVGPRAGDAVDAALVALGHPAETARRTKAYDNIALDPQVMVWRGEPLDGVDSFELSVPREQAATARAALAMQAAALSPGARLALRLEAGRPEFLVDMTAETIPLEANLLDRAISTSKGCYVGQEVIIRVLHRGGGRVARKLASLTFSGGVPATGSMLSAGDREAGRVTSAAFSPRDGAAIGLGYVPRDFAQQGAALMLADGSSAVVTAV